MPHDPNPQILEVGKTVDAGSITKAYRKLARKKHPDKGGDPEEFKALSEAYEVGGGTRDLLREREAARPARPAAAELMQSVSSRS